MIQTAESIFIASIYPGQLQPITKQVGPGADQDGARSTVYKLDPVPRGSAPCVIEVSDAFEFTQDFQNGTIRGMKGGTPVPRLPRLVACEDIANNLVQEWGGNMFGLPNGAGPGILVMKFRDKGGALKRDRKGNPIEMPQPTKEEMQEMLQSLALLAQHYVGQADLSAQGGHPEWILPVHRLMCKWLKRKRAWLDPFMEEDMAEVAALVEPRRSAPVAPPAA